jgi:hypothetical protein
MSRLYQILKGGADSNPADFDIDWSNVKSGQLYDKDHTTRQRVLQSLNGELEHTLIVLNGAPQHICMTVPDLKDHGVAFVPHYASKIGRADHSQEDVDVQLGRNKAVLNHLGYENLDDFLQSNEVENPKAVAYALMEVPPHATGMPKEKDYQPLKEVVDRKVEFGFQRVHFIGEDINPEGKMNSIGDPNYIDVPSVNFLTYCRDNGLKIDIAKF